MYAHIQLGVRNLVLMCDFYDRVLVHFGLERITALEKVGPAGVYWRRPGQRWPQFVINHPFDGREATVGNGSQVSFLADRRATVEAAWNTAMALGGSDEGPPGLRPCYASDFYAAYCRDPEGHKLCFVHTRP
ncbi:VOC family protein [Variovorax sp. NFACC27]|uniref:VOC family protein n=1 Tax=unclassified Variovorax TaxID=663243 RepID=UPI000895DB3D|nr:Catechol 2,3-dioxygenase [Variovorax sp. NFACC28]SEG97758.1 Catechol 2,3-dioxygenase [Variovorax sp. NFACC29]SFE00522.1 Catechol 2,3-dioxygenase [Variovorax sp. NFACC26]SFH23077.1 Catechol 2,3-dioxygenase [Variovorax sp. NFACC27]